MEWILRNKKNSTKIPTQTSRDKTFGQFFGKIATKAVARLPGQRLLPDFQDSCPAASRCQDVAENCRDAHGYAVFRYAISNSPNVYLHSTVEYKMSEYRISFPGLHTEQNPPNSKQSFLISE